jgi:hypothetical protein
MIPRISLDVKGNLFIIKFHQVEIAGRNKTLKINYLIPLQKGNQFTQLSSFGVVYVNILI